MQVTTHVLTGFAAGSGLFGVGLAGLLAWRGSTRPSPLVGGLLAVGLAGIVSELGLDAGLSIFGVAHLGYLGLVVALPLFGALMLAVPRLRPPRRSGVALCVLLLLPVPVGVYMTHVEPYWARTDRVTVGVDRARAGHEALRIAVMADFQAHHIRGHERGAFSTLLRFHADLIVLPGDLFQGSDAEFHRQLPQLNAQLARLHAPGGVYYVRGDTDPDSRIGAIFRGTHVRVLDDEIVTVHVRDRTVRLGGTRLDWLSDPAKAVRDELASSPEDGAIRLLMSHRPDTVLPLPARARVDLTIAGHTHGGQLVVPGFGPLMTMSRVPRSVARGGLHLVDGNQIYVSPGFGLERIQAPQVRLFDRPAITLLTLRDRT